MDSTEYYFGPEFFAGEIFVGEFSIPFRASVYVKHDFRMIFEVEPLGGQNPFQYYSVIERSMAPPGQLIPKASLKAISDSGNTLESDHVECLPGDIDATGLHIKVQPQTAKLKISFSQKCETQGLKMYLRGFKCFRCYSIETPLGQLGIGGRARGVLKDDVSGVISIEAPKERDPTLWRNEAEPFLDFVRNGLVLANGGRLQVPLIEYWNEGILEANFYAGYGFERESPRFCPTLLQPYLTILAGRYFEQPLVPEILWTALYWMHAETTFDEIRFLSGMTALEAIISNLPKIQVNQLPDNQFKKLLDSLRKAIDQFQELDEHAKNHFKRGVGTLNGKLFIEKIGVLFSHFDIPRIDFDDDTIEKMERWSYLCGQFGGMVKL